MSASAPSTKWSMCTHSCALPSSLHFSHASSTQRICQKPHIRFAGKIANHALDATIRNSVLLKNTKNKKNKIGTVIANCNRELGRTTIWNSVLSKKQKKINKKKYLRTKSRTEKSRTRKEQQSETFWFCTNNTNRKKRTVCCRIFHLDQTGIKVDLWC